MALGNSALDELGLSGWIEGMLGEVPEVRDSKAIHCPVLGTHVLYPHEIAVLDSALTQRLLKRCLLTSSS